MDFDLLSDAAPLFAIDVLSSDLGPDAATAGYDDVASEWTNPLAFNKLLDEPGTPEASPSRKRGFDEVDDSSSTGSLTPPNVVYDAPASVLGLDAGTFSPLSLWEPLDSPSTSRPKRARSASFEAILKGLPDEGFRSSTGSTECGSSDDEYVFGRDPGPAMGDDVVHVFPNHPSEIRTPTQSPTTVRHSVSVSPKRQSSSLVESHEKPNFLKPLSASERQRLRTAGHGAAIIRVNSDLSFS